MWHLRDRADWPFSWTIFIIRADATINNVLIMLTNLLNKIIWFEDTVTRKIIINLNTMIQAHFSIVFFSSNIFLTLIYDSVLNMDISTYMIKTYSYSSKIFIITNIKVIIGTPFQLGLKIIYIHTRSREEIIVVEISFVSNINLFFFVKRPVIWFFMLIDLTFGTFFKSNETG